MRRLLWASAAVVLMSGCSSYSAALHEQQGKTTVYTLTTEQAQKVVQVTMLEAFPGRELEELPKPTIGYTTYTRALIDTWSTTVTIAPVVAKQGTNVFDAVEVHTSGGGTSFFSGRIAYEEFKTKLKAALDKTASVEYVDATTMK